MTERHQCEVRYVLQLRSRGRAEMDEYLGAVERRRGVDAMNRLKFDARDQWIKGNRGKWGEWK